MNFLPCWLRDRWPLAAQILATVVLLVSGHSAWAAWPEKRIVFIVPYSAGGGADIVARLIAHNLAPLLGQPVVVENRAGASGNIGMEAAARAPADGYTIVLGSSGQSAAASYFKKLQYDMLRDFVPVSLSVYNSRLLVGRLGLPYDNVAGLIAYAKKNPGKVTFASWGSGSGAHLAGELFKQMAGVDMLHVPYKGNSDAVSDLMGGQVDIMFSEYGTVLEQVKAGKLKAFGVPSEKRFPGLDVPTISESGLPGFEYSGWLGILAPVGTPPAVAKTISDAVDKVVNLPQVREQLAKIGAGPIGGYTPDRFRSFLQADISKWQTVMQKAGLVGVEQ